MKIETVIARVLSVGTALSCTIMTIGLVVGDQRTAVVGIACLIALPVLRVAILVVAFAKRCDMRLVAAGLTVLAIIGLGIAIGFRAARAPGPRSGPPLHSSALDDHCARSGA
jgi:uncharacterized membrane protein